MVITSFSDRGLTGDEVVAFARGVVDEDRRGELLGHLAEFQRIAAAEPGTLLYEWCADRTDPSVLWAYEIHADVEAPSAHSRNIRSLLPALGACFRAPPTPHRCVPLTIPS